ncbi:parB-like partition protein (plasmid) [Planctopirus limnophila DSM 3776]|uniref:ParB-like partition protein n=2 Tax=Planctopirus limnophila TaxID=120 RepID=D5SZI3_PLAL2|nr:parB-like partition protein [Planctopirus limnophila DSM 3776]
MTKTEEELLNPTYVAALALGSINDRTKGLHFEHGHSWVTSEVNHALRNLESMCSPTPEEEEFFMATKTKPAPAKPTKATKPAKPKETAPEVTSESSQEHPGKAFIVDRSRDIPLSQLDPSPWQVRKKTSSEWIAELGQSLLDDGQLAPLLVRLSKIINQGSLANRYEIIAGHTRAFAAGQVGLKSLRCDILECDDETAQRLVLIDNAKRKDLTKIEQAQALKALVETYEAAGKSQRQLAADIGISQGQISNLTRLLLLPPEVQELVISGEITQASAREAVPMLQHPKIAKAFVAEIADIRDVAVEEAERQGEEARIDLMNSIRSVVREIGQPLDGQIYYKGRWVNRAFKLTPEIEEQLDIVDLSSNPKDPRRYALNKKLFEELQDKAEAKKKADEQKGIEGKCSGKKQLTPAQQKEKDKQQAEQLAARIAKWKIRIQKDMVCDWIDTTASEREMVSVLGWLWLHWQHHSEKRVISESLREALQESGMKDFNPDERELVKALLKADQPKDDLVFPQVLRSMGLKILRRCEVAPFRIADPEIIQIIFDYARLNIETVWASAYGEDVEEFFGMHSTAQLTALAKELKISVSSPKKIDMIDDLLQHCWGKPCPKSIIDAKAADASGKW